MNIPNKQEMEQLRSLKRQLSRLTESTNNLYLRMVINGRERHYCDLAMDASKQLKRLAKQVEDLTTLKGGNEG